MEKQIYFHCQCSQKHENTCLLVLMVITAWLSVRARAGPDILFHALTCSLIPPQSYISFQSSSSYCLCGSKLVQCLQESV